MAKMAKEGLVSKRVPRRAKGYVGSLIVTYKRKAGEGEGEPVKVHGCQRSATRSATSHPDHYYPPAPLSQTQTESKSSQFLVSPQKL